MTVKLFSNDWESRHIDLKESEKFWDMRAEEFAAHKDSREKIEGIENLLSFFESNGVIHNAAKILDIGCGPGIYTVEFGKRVREAMGIDISSEMLKYARANSRAEGLGNTSFKKAAWEEVDLDEYGWSRKFDLVFASMSPGISSRDALLKMVHASRGYCFMSSFAYRRDIVRQNLEEIIFGGAREHHNGATIYYSFNTLWEAGYYPEIFYRDTEWENILSLDQALFRYTHWLTREQALDKKQQIKIHEYLESISIDGFIKEHTEAKIGYMLWKVC